MKIINSFHKPYVLSSYHCKWYKGIFSARLLKNNNNNMVIKGNNNKIISKNAICGLVVDWVLISSQQVRREKENSSNLIQVWFSVHEIHHFILKKDWGK